MCVLDIPTREQRIECLTCGATLGIDLHTNERKKRRRMQHGAPLALGPQLSKLGVFVWTGCAPEYGGVLPGGAVGNTW